MGRVAFLGLGVMGGPMAGHLLRAGQLRRAWNRGEARRNAWEARFVGDATHDVEAAVDGAEAIALCLGDDPDVREVFDRIESLLRPGQLLVDHTTASAALARELGARCAARGVGFLDAPVSGGQAGAEAGRLTVMCGGAAEDLARAEPWMRAYAARITLVGPVGSGQLAKSVNQICIAGVVQGLAEGLHFAEQEGLDIAAVIAAISGGAAQSWQMENRWQTMRDGRFDFGFAVDLMRKDLRITLEAARRNGASLPLTALVDQHYAEVQRMGGGRWDTSSLIARLRRAGGGS